ncbi:MAG: hypothetical protein IJ463_06740 [Bacilli bacterium]|nr:hypothetical protein [Bacilli bacterium]
MRYFKRHKFISLILIALSVYLYINYTRIIEENPNIDKNSPAYINDIYMSDERIYNNYLSETEKIAYDELKDMFKKRQLKRELDINKYSGKSSKDISTDIMNAGRALLIDHPEMLQLSSYGYRYDDTMIQAKIEFAINNPIMESLNTLRIRRIIDNIKRATKDMSDREKIKYVYEWIGDNNTYDELFTYTSKNQSIYNVFIKGNAVCAGFAKASQVIFQNIGIESMTITGESTGPHMWNIIKLDGKYYYYDSTYAASIKEKDNKNYYGGLKQEEMNSYIPDKPHWYPIIEKENGLLEEIDKE